MSAKPPSCPYLLFPLLYSSFLLPFSRPDNFSEDMERVLGLDNKLNPSLLAFSTIPGMILFQFQLPEIDDFRALSVVWSATCQRVTREHSRTTQQRELERREILPLTLST